MLPSTGRIKEHLDLMDERLETYEDWRREVMKWARAKRMEHGRNKHAGGGGFTGYTGIPNQAPTYPILPPTYEPPPANPWEGMKGDS